MNNCVSGLAEGPRASWLSRQTFGRISLSGTRVQRIDPPHHRPNVDPDRASRSPSRLWQLHSVEDTFPSGHHERLGAGDFRFDGDSQWGWMDRIWRPRGTHV